MKTKICRTCSILKPIKEFNKLYADYLKYQCKSCEKEYKRRYYQANKDGILAEQKKYYESNRNAINERKKGYYKSHFEETKKYQKQWRNEHYQEMKEYHINYKINNIYSIKQIREKYKETHKNKTKNWRKNNRDKINVQNANYRAAYLKAIPENQTEEEKEQIRLFYKNCPKGMHVDHIIPLQGQKIKGKHELKNLQYLTAEENFRKKNKFPYYSMEFYIEKGLI